MLTASSVAPDYARRFLANDANYLFAASISGVPVGFLLAHRLERLKQESHKLFIYEVDVAEPFRRTGIGRRLIEAAKTVVESESMICAFVLTDHRNEAAIQLYQNTGGVAVNGDDLMFVYHPPDRAPA